MVACRNGHDVVDEKHPYGKYRGWSFSCDGVQCPGCQFKKVAPPPPPPPQPPKPPETTTKNKGNGVFGGIAGIVAIAAFGTLVTGNDNESGNGSGQNASRSTTTFSQNEPTNFSLPNIGKFVLPFFGLHTINYTDGSVYVGQLENGLRVGKGRFERTNGYKYEGEWANNLENGVGTITYPDGKIFNGRFFHGAIYGEGTVFYPNGNIFIGEFIGNLTRNGYGTFIYDESGDRYEGQWVNDERHGIGKYTWKDGQIYEGEFQDNLIQGHGKIFYANGDIYEGEFEGNSKRNGYGVMHYSFGAVYEGEWLNGNRQGVGTFTRNDIVMTSDMFNEDIIDVHIQYPDGSTFDGKVDMKASKKFGDSVVINFANGEKFEGFLENTQIQDVYQLNSYGVFTTDDGETFTGYFSTNEDGEFVIDNAGWFKRLDWYLSR